MIDTSKHFYVAQGEIRKIKPHLPAEGGCKYGLGHCILWLGQQKNVFVCALLTKTFFVVEKDESAMYL